MGQAAEPADAEGGGEWDGEWEVPAAVGRAVLGALSPSEDATACHYAAKAVENVLTCAGAAGAGSLPAALCCPAVLSALLTLATASALPDTLRATAAAAAAHSLRLAPPLAPLLLESPRLPAVLGLVREGAPRLAAPLANLLSSALLAPQARLELAGPAGGAAHAAQRGLSRAAVALLCRTHAPLRLKGALLLSLLGSLGAGWLAQLADAQLLAALEQTAELQPAERRLSLGAAEPSPQPGAEAEDEPFGAGWAQVRHALLSALALSSCGLRADSLHAEAAGAEALLSGAQSPRPASPSAAPRGQSPLGLLLALERSTPMAPERYRAAPAAALACAVCWLHRLQPAATPPADAAPASHGLQATLEAHAALPPAMRASSGSVLGAGAPHFTAERRAACREIVGLASRALAPPSAAHLPPAALHLAVDCLLPALCALLDEAPDTSDHADLPDDADVLHISHGEVDLLSAAALGAVAAVVAAAIASAEPATLAALGAQLEVHLLPRCSVLLSSPHAAPHAIGLLGAAAAHLPRLGELLDSLRLAPLMPRLMAGVASAWTRGARGSGGDDSALENELGAAPAEGGAGLGDVCTLLRVLCERPAPLIEVGLVRLLAQLLGLLAPPGHGSAPATPRHAVAPPRAAAGPLLDLVLDSSYVLLFFVLHLDPAEAEAERAAAVAEAGGGGAGHGRGALSAAAIAAEFGGGAEFGPHWRAHLLPLLMPLLDRCGQLVRTVAAAEPPLAEKAARVLGLTAQLLAPAEPHAACRAVLSDGAALAEALGRTDRLAARLFVRKALSCIEAADALEYRAALAAQPEVEAAVVRCDRSRRG